MTCSDRPSFRAVSLLLVAGLLACGGDKPSPGGGGESDADADADTDADTDADADADTDADADADADADTGDTGKDTGDPDDTGGDTAETAEPLPEFDCSTVPAGIVSNTVINGAKGHHEVLFDASGYAIGNTNGSLFRALYGSSGAPWIPGVGTIEQMDWLPDGDIAAATSVGIKRISTAGSITTIASNIAAYGLIVGPDGMIYAAANSRVYRIDPATGDDEILVPTGALVSGTPRVLEFSPDYARLYVGTLSTGGGAAGGIYYLPLNEDLNPTGPPALFVAGVGAGYHDAMGVDICGNIYIGDYTTSAFYRVKPDGTIQTLQDPPLTGHVHGMDWGSGIKGWRDDAIYGALPYNNDNVAEIVIGVPSRRWPGVGINATPFSVP